jgi:hypothetical protein
MIGAGRPDAGDVALDSRDPDRRRVIDALMTVPRPLPRPGRPPGPPETVKIVWKTA